MKYVRHYHKFVIAVYRQGEKTATHSLTIWDKRHARAALLEAMDELPTLNADDWDIEAGYRVKKNGGLALIADTACRERTMIADFEVGHVEFDSAA